MASQKVFRYRNTQLIAILGNHRLQNTCTVSRKFLIDQLSDTKTFIVT